MRVILFILLALVGSLLFVDWTNQKPAETRNGPVRIDASPLVLDSADPERTKLGQLQFLGAWHLTSPNRGFGGLSAMLIGPDERIWALNDSGYMFIFPKPGTPGMGAIFRMRAPKIRPTPYQYPTDSESLTADPGFQNLWVGFELVQRICRFPPDLRKESRCVDRPEVANWPPTESIESLARLPDGRFLAISEGEGGPNGGREMLLFANDPVKPSTPKAVSMSYMPPAGYDPTDALYIGGNKLLVLNRRATIYDGFTAIITLVDIGHVGPGAVLGSRIVARLAPPVLADNFEGLALERRNGQRILWVVSDDNHLFFERTLLLKFALPESM